MESRQESETVNFECNICGERCLVAIDQLRREIASCGLWFNTEGARHHSRVFNRIVWPEPRSS